MAFDLGSYNTVPERLIEAREKYPDGRLRPVPPAGLYEIVEVAGEHFIVYAAAFHRDRDDDMPAVALAWEPFPGKTNYTRNSELQNAETSAWGRAIVAALAADTRKGIASAEDVQNRRAEQEGPLLPPIPGFRSSLIAAIQGLSDAERALVREFVAEAGLPDTPAKMNAAEADRVCDFIMSLPVDGGGGSGGPSSAPVLPSPDGEPT